MIDARMTAVVRTGTEYPQEAPFDPVPCPPEYPWKEVRGSGAQNHAYDGVRRALAALGLDAGAFGKASWNPLGGIVKPGDTVLLKPNLVCEHRENRPDQWVQIVTSAAVVRAVLDYVCIALSGSGRVVIADSPQTDSDFGMVSARTGLLEMASAISRRSGLAVEVLDLRSERWLVSGGICVGTEKLTGDPAGVRRIDLADRSHFAGTPETPLFYGAGYDTAQTNAYHSAGRHVYEVCGTALASDVIISIPKLKTHKKCGMTGCLKGMVGLAGNKNLLPHYRFGPPSKGGDQFPDGRRRSRFENISVGAAKRMLVRGGKWTGFLFRALKPIGYRVFGSTARVVRSGNWPGNDTIWRTVLDLAAIFTYCDASGKILDRPARRFFNVVDGIIGGEGNGPLDADPVGSGLIVAGSSPLVVDAVTAAAAGFGPMALRLIGGGFVSPWGFAPCPPDSVKIVVDPGNRIEGLDSMTPLVEFRSHFAWGPIR